MHKVSVVIPCYNCSSTIGETINSVMDQTYTNFEIIVVDDGSTDCSSEILKKFRDDVHLITQQNSGAAQARNSGIKYAQGDLIAFLDADDSWLPDKLKLQVDKINEGYDLVHCPAINVGELGSWNPPITQTVMIAPENYLEALFLGNLIVTSSVLVKKSCVERAGGFDSRLRNCQDWDLWIRLASCCRITSLERPLVKYRIDSNSLSSSADKVLSAGLSVLRNNKRLLPETKRNKIFRASVYKMYLNGCWRHLRARNNKRAMQCALQAILINPIKLEGWLWLARALRDRVGFN